MDNEMLEDIAYRWYNNVSCFECPIKDKCKDLGGVCQTSFIECLYALIKGED